MTDPTAGNRIIDTIDPAVRQRLEDLKAGRGTSGPVIPDDIRAAIHAGHVGQVTIFCDECGFEDTADYTGETREDRFEAARRHLAAVTGWTIDDDEDLCPACSTAEAHKVLDSINADLDRADGAR